MNLIQESTKYGNDFEVYDLGSIGFEFVHAGYFDVGGSDQYVTASVVLTEAQVDRLIERLQIVLAERGEQTSLI